MAEKRKFKVSAERLVIFGLLIALTFTLAGFAIASAATKIPAGNGLVRFCRDNTSGAARIVQLTTKCATTEQKVQMRSYDPIALEYDGTPGGPPGILNNIGGHVTGVTRTDIGQYIVTFDRIVTNCVAIATPAAPNNYYAVNGNAVNDHEKVVYAFLLANNSPSDIVFSLVMTC